MQQVLMYQKEMILLKRLCNYEYVQKVNAKETIDTNDLVINVDCAKNWRYWKDNS